MSEQKKEYKLLVLTTHNGLVLDTYICKEGEHVFEDYDSNHSNTCLDCGSVVDCNSKGHYYNDDQDSDLTFSKETYEALLGHSLTSPEWDIIKSQWYSTFVGTIEEMT